MNWGEKNGSVVQALATRVEDVIRLNWSIVGRPCKAMQGSDSIPIPIHMLDQVDATDGVNEISISCPELEVSISASHPH